MKQFSTFKLTNWFHTITMTTITVGIIVLPSANARGINTHHSLNTYASNDTIRPKEKSVDSIADNDSVYNLLPGVDITAARSFHTAGASYYIPSKREKNVSTDAMTLLEHMMIPEISKNGDGNYVSFTGKEVKYYINGHLAQPDELRSMDMSSVKKVCYLDHPSEAKYLGADYVVEFILQEYAYGGYTKLGETMGFLGQYNFDEYVNSKFSYRRMTYNIFVEAKNYRNFKDASRSVEKFILRDINLTQSNLPKYSDKKMETYPVQFSAVYRHGNTYISNEVSFLYNSTMRHNVDGSLAYNFVNQEMKHQKYDYFISQPGKDYTASWNGYASFVFGKGWSLGIGSSVRFTHYVKTYEYSTTQSFSIVRNTRENSLEGELNAMLIKDLGKFGNLSFNLNSNLLSSHTDYRGDSESDNSFSYPFLSGSVVCSFNVKDLSVWSRVGVASEWNKLKERNSPDEFKSNTVYPFVALNIGYSPNRKISSSLWLQCSTFTPAALAKNPILVRMSEHLYRQGNPEVKPYKNYEVGPSFTWSPSNTLSLGVNAMYTHRHKPLRLAYNLDESGEAVVMSYGNNGNTHVFNLGMSASLRLIGNSLSLSARPSATFYRGKGINSPNVNSLGIDAMANYYFGNFYAGVSCMLSDKKYTTPSMYEIKKTRPDYSFKFGWGDGNWTANLTLSNIFRTSWEGNRFYLYSPVYTSISTDLNVDFRQTVQLSLTYTIGYGKKIDRRDELGHGVKSATSVVM